MLTKRKLRSLEVRFSATTTTANNKENIFVIHSDALKKKNECFICVFSG